MAVSELLDVSIYWLLTGKKEPKNEKYDNEKFNFLFKKYSLLSDENKAKIDTFIEIATLNTKTKIDKKVASITKSTKKSLKKMKKYTMLNL